jgi:hypothetical protein
MGPIGYNPPIGSNGNLKLAAGKKGQRSMRPDLIGIFRRVAEGKMAITTTTRRTRTIRKTGGRILLRQNSRSEIGRWKRQDRNAPRYLGGYE